MSRRSPRGSSFALAAALLLAACSSSDDGTAASASGARRATSTVSRSEPSRGDPAKDCPSGFTDERLEPGTHDDFASGGQQRSFHLLAPADDASGAPHPLMVAITGTVQEEQDFLAQSQLDRLADEGWIVVAPVRNENGKVWGPWDAMRAPSDASPNPDEQLVLDLVTCLAAHYPVDVKRQFVSGISIGGTMVNYMLRRHSDVFAGGIVGSGNFILTEPPDPQPLDDMTVIVTWGGPNDQWTGCPDGRMGEQYATEPGCVTADFVADAAAATKFFASEPKVRTLACSEDTGHIWISHATQYWAEVLAVSPKGTATALERVAADAPEPMTCDVPT